MFIKLYALPVKCCPCARKKHFYELYPEYQDFVLRQIDELIDLQNIKQEKE